MNCSDGRIDRNGEGSSARGRERTDIFNQRIRCGEVKFQFMGGKGG